MRQHITIQRAIFFHPEALTFFQNPVTDRALGEANRTSVAHLVGEIQFPARVGDDRLGEFSAHDGP